MIQNLLNTAGPTCVIPPGVYDIPEQTRLTIPFGVERIIGDGATVRVVDGNGNRSTAMPTGSLFDCGLRPDNTRLDVRGLTIIGPDTAGWDPNAGNPHAAINWVHARTWGGTFTVDGVTVGGGYGYGVQRSGGGRFEIHNSSLSGWVGGCAFFESVGTGGGSMIVRNVTMTAPDNSKYSSIGAYIHPHLDVTWDNVSASGWNRYAIYLNGSPQSAGHHLFADVTATDCSLIQTGSSSETTLVRCVEQGTPTNGGSFFKGPVLSVGSTWAGNGMIGFMSNNTPARRFVRDTIKTQRTFIAAATGAAGTILLNNCDVQLGDKTQVLKLSGGGAVAATVVSTTHTGTGAQFIYNLESGSLRFVDTTPPARLRFTGTGVLLP